MASNCGSINKIVVVDNNSPDGSYDKLKELENEKIDVIQTTKNGGYAYGNNFGCYYAINNYNPDVIFVSNPDVRFDDSVIKALQSEILRDEKIGVIAPIVNQGYNVWNTPGFWGVIEAIFLVAHNIHKRNIKKKLLKCSNNVQYVGVVEGSFWCTRKEVFLKIGGLDEKTFLYFEENILSKRLKKHGFTEAVLTREKYDHFHSVSIKKRYGGKAKAFKNFYDSMKIYLKDYLDCNAFQLFVFDIFFSLGYLERILYDFIILLKSCLRK
jgi:GT2 family glycosyltransferase